MISLDSTAVTCIHITARAGANIGDCMREAALLAVSEVQNVELTHGGNTYRVLFNDLIGEVREVVEAAP